MADAGAEVRLARHAGGVFVADLRRSVEIPLSEIGSILAPPEGHAGALLMRPERGAGANVLLFQAPAPPGCSGECQGAARVTVDRQEAIEDRRLRLPRKRYVLQALTDAPMADLVIHLPLREVSDVPKAIAPPGLLVNLPQLQAPSIAAQVYGASHRLQAEGVAAIFLQLSETTGSGARMEECIYDDETSSNDMAYFPTCPGATVTSEGFAGNATDESPWLDSLVAFERPSGSLGLGGNVSGSVAGGVAAWGAWLPYPPPRVMDLMSAPGEIRTHRTGQYDASGRRLRLSFRCVGNGDCRAVISSVLTRPKTVQLRPRERQAVFFRLRKGASAGRRSGFRLRVRVTQAGGAASHQVVRVHRVA